MKEDKKDTPDRRLPFPSMNCQLAKGIITATLREEILKTGHQKAVVGLSGGIDSALSLYLCVEALGAENVFALFMPYRLSSQASRDDAVKAAKEAGVNLLTREITGPADAYFDAQDSEASRLRRGNFLARLRMLYLYDYSAEKRALVVGTSNKTEMLLGYSTLWGDMASAVNPIGDLYKTQVRALSSFMGVPASIIEKAPSADLWEGQTDESELDISYAMADRILYHWADQEWSPERIVEALDKAGVSGGNVLVSRIMQMVRGSQYKRKMPVIVKVSHRTIDREFRYPRDWGL